jgi:hypothetical protein
LLNTSDRKRSYPARDKRVVFVVFGASRRLRGQRRGASGACHTTHDSSAAASSLLGNSPSTNNRHLRVHVAVLFLEHLRFLRPYFNGVLFDRPIPDAIIEVEDGDASSVNKVDPLIIGDGDVWHNTSSRHDQSFLHARI